jgi:hypothetical protein
VTEPVAKRSRFSRFRRLPPIFRFGDHKGPDPGLEEQRLTLYVPAKILDQAEEQAQRAGVETVQQYCQELLEQAIETEHAREVVQHTEAKRGTLEGLDAIANDPTYLAEWSAMRERSGPSREERNTMPPPDGDPAEEAPTAIPAPRPAGTEAMPSLAVQVVLRHAALEGDDPAGFLATLRRGEPVRSATSQELLQALRDLEVEHRSATSIDRRLAYALHRLAFEGQVQLTDAWSAEPVDEPTVDVLRIVQESVDRVLSGEDIRYYAPEPGPERQR